MFEPLILEEPANASLPSLQREHKVPMIPVPPEAPPMSFRHPRYGSPTRQYEYRLAGGELAGYAGRFDYTGADGEPEKEFLPITYCDLGDGRRGWRSKGIPAPRPLYRLPDLVSHPDVPVLVCEGEKAADAAACVFPDWVVTSPMHGAKSPHQADWTPLSGRSVTIWPDHDDPGADFAQKVAKLALEAGAISVAIVEVPKDWPPKWDLADPRPDGIDPATLRHLGETGIPQIAAKPDPMPPMPPKSLISSYRVVTCRQPPANCAICSRHADTFSIAICP